MSRTEHPPASADLPGRWSLVGLSVLALVCYANSLDAPFVFDGGPFVRDNPAIRRLWPLDNLLSVSGARPLGYYTFALNYAVHGLDVRGYHLVNIVIHLGLGCLLYALIVRTLRLPRLQARYRRHAGWPAMFVAAVWVAHPLGTQAVTNLYQRLESLAALGCVATLYAMVRGVTADQTRSKRRWFAASVVCFIAATAVKESAAVTPLVVAWYDRVFLTESWRQVIRERGRFYLALCSVWILQAVLLWVQRDIFAAAGVLVVEGLSPLAYAANQSAVIAHYLRLVVWPIGQCFDYAWRPAASPVELLVPATLTIAAVGVTGYGLLRGRMWSFLPGAFFLFLAPTSSIVPIVDLAVEHRMYLPSAALIAGLTLGAYRPSIRFWAERPADSAATRAAAFAAIVVVGLLSWRTIERNTVYAGEIELWTDVLRVAPHNDRAYANLAAAHLERREFDTADAYCRKAIDLNPRAPMPHYTLGTSYYRRKRYEEAEQSYKKAIELRPEDPETLVALGMTYGVREMRDEAADCFRRALVIVPTYEKARRYLALVVADKPQSAARPSGAGTP
jgi:tetratricopeptide (TPR) repeat protein